MKMPIIEGLIKYNNENNVRFHMPGHKGKNVLVNWKDIIPEIDLTEVKGTDNLHNPTSIILKSQEMAAETFGAKKTFYSINGTTGGIYSAIMAVTKPGDKILIQRNSHKSVYNAAILGRLRLKYLYPKYNEKDRMVTGVSAGDIDNILATDKDIKAVVITYPTYYGICSDIEKICNIVHKHNRILIVDEAHGSHFVFDRRLPKPALNAGVDIVIQSTHKTLPAFTQASMVHVGSDRVDIERLRTMLSITQTTSPSYILMASLDYARAYMESEGKEKLGIIIDSLIKYKEYLKGLNGVRIFDLSNKNSDDFYDFDITKLLISLSDINIKGTSLEKILREKYRIQLEMSDYYYGLALITAFDEIKNIEKLVYAIEDLSKNKYYDEETIIDLPIKYIKPRKKLNLYEAFYMEKEEKSLKESVGKISGTFIIPYPPGIPILCPGEIITEEIVYYIETLKNNSIEILGFLDYNKENIRVINQ